MPAPNIREYAKKCRIQHVLPIVKAGKIENKLVGETSWPFRLENVLNDEAAYRFAIDVIGEGLAKTIRFIVVWTNRWDAMSGQKA